MLFQSRKNKHNSNFEMITNIDLLWFYRFGNIFQIYDPFQWFNVCLYFDSMESIVIIALCVDFECLFDIELMFWFSFIYRISVNHNNSIAGTVCRNTTRNGRLDNSTESGIDQRWWFDGGGWVSIKSSSMVRKTWVKMGRICFADLRLSLFFRFFFMILGL